MSEDYGLGEAIAKASFRQYAATFLYIENESGEIEPFVLNEAQLIVDEEVERQIAAERPVRVLILKGRQQGMSTYCQGRLGKAALTKRTRCQTVGHMLSAVHELWGKHDRFWKELSASEKAQALKSAGVDLQPPLEPGMGEKGRRTVYRDPLGSVLRYDSAQDPESVGRGTTQHCCHFTEIPQWAKPAETMQAVLSCVPDLPGTMIFVETTAKGSSGWFYEKWIEAMADVKRGIEPEFVPVFVPWHKTKRYARKLRNGEPRLDKAEKVFRDKYNLTNEQCYWYRDQRRKHGEKVTEEYPSTWEEAFLSSGLPFFRRDIMPQYREATRDPERVGQFHFYDKQTAAWQKMPGGPTHIFADPVAGHRYVVGIDFASGRAKDYNTFVVYDADSMEVVAVHKSKWLPDQMLDEAVCIAKIYNKALIVPERNGIGQALVDRLTRELGYRNVYREEDPSRVKYHKGAKHGFATSATTRKWLLEALAKAVHRLEISIPDERVIDEMDKFVFVDDDGERAEAGENANDDLVIALALALRGATQLPKKLSEESRKRPLRRAAISGRTGY
jgi:hypothetical protein